MAKNKELEKLYKLEKIKRVQIRKNKRNEKFKLLKTCEKCHNVFNHILPIKIEPYQEVVNNKQILVRICSICYNNLKLDI